MANFLTEIRDTLDQIVKMRELSEQLLETLTLAMYRTRDYARRNNIPLPDESIFIGLLDNAQSLIDQMANDSPPFLQHRKRTPSEETEPDSPINKTEKKHGQVHTKNEGLLRKH